MEIVAAVDGGLSPHHREIEDVAALAPVVRDEVKVITRNLHTRGQIRKPEPDHGATSRRDDPLGLVSSDFGQRRIRRLLGVHAS